MGPVNKDFFRHVRMFRNDAATFVADWSAKKVTEFPSRPAHLGQA
jgi:hypothetical protein